MKNILVFSLILMMISCGKKEIEKEVLIEENSFVPKYDTIAVDSFSVGATSVNIANKIKISSQRYQDSLKEIQKKMETEKALKKETEEKDKAAKKLEEEKKKADEIKAKKEKEQTKPVVLPIENTPNH